MPVVIHSAERMAGERLPANVLELRVSGKLHKADYESLRPRLEQMIVAHGKVRLLVELVDFHGWDLGAMWEDLKLDVRHYADFDRIAVLGQTGSQHLITDLFKPFTKAKVKYFQLDQRDEAETWIAD